MPNSESENYHAVPEPVDSHLNISLFEKDILSSANSFVRMSPEQTRTEILKELMIFLHHPATYQLDQSEILADIRVNILLSHMYQEFFRRKLDLAIQLTHVVSSVIPFENRERTLLLLSDWLFPSIQTDEPIRFEEYLDTIGADGETASDLRRVISLLSSRWKAKVSKTKNKYVTETGYDTEGIGKLAYKGILGLPFSPITADTFLHHMKILFDGETIDDITFPKHHRKLLIREVVNEFVNNYQHVRAYLQLPVEIRKQLGLRYPGKSAADVIKLITVSSLINTALFFAGRGADVATYVIANNSLLIESLEKFPSIVTAGTVLAVLISEGILIYSEIKTLSNAEVGFTSNPTVTALHHVFGLTPLASVVGQRILSRTVGEVGNLPFIVGISFAATQDIPTVWVANKLVSSAFYLGEAGTNLAFPPICSALRVLKAKTEVLFEYNIDKNI